MPARLDTPGTDETIASHDLSGEAIGRRVREIATRVHEAILTVIDELPVAADGPQAFARQLGVHKSLATKLLIAIRSADPIAVIKNLPRSEGMGIFLRAAEASVNKENVRKARTAIGEFHTLVKRDLGGWDALDVAIGSWLPEARADAELACGRQAFNGLRGALGVTADVLLATLILYPSGDGANFDAAIVATTLGLRRLRPGKEIPVDSLGPRPGSPDQSQGFTSLSEKPNADGLPLMESFCSSPLPPFRVITTGNLQDCVMAGDAFGVRSAVDLCLGVAIRCARPLYQPEAGPRIRAGASTTISVPVKKLILNVLVEDSVFSKCEPELVVYRTHERGPANPSDPTRDIDRMDTSATIQYLGRDPHGFRVTEFARSLELIQYVCGKLNWDINRLRGYRCRVQYPFLIGQYSIVFDQPERPKPPSE